MPAASHVGPTGMMRIEFVRASSGWMMLIAGVGFASVIYERQVW